MSLPVAGTVTTLSVAGAYPYNPSLTHNAAGASALVVIASSAGGYSWAPTATFAGVPMVLLASSTSTGGQGTQWVYGLADPPQISGAVTLLRNNEYGDTGALTAINFSGTADAPFSPVTALHGNASVTASLTGIEAGSLLLGAAHDHYTSAAPMTAPAGAVALWANKTNINHQSFGFTRAAVGSADSMTFTTAFNSVGAVLIALRPAPGRNAVKPSGALTPSATGQYAQLRAFYAFNEASGNAVNLAQPAADALVITGGSRANGALGRYYVPGGTALSTLPASAGTGIDLDLEAAGPWTVFARCAPPGFNEGEDRTLFSVGSGSAGGIEVNCYGTVWEAYAGDWRSIGERPSTTIQTVVLSYDGTTLRFYINGTAQQSHTVTLSHAGTVKLGVGHDQRAAFKSFANRVYELGSVKAAWSAAEAAAYDAAPLGVLGAAAPPVTELAPSPVATPAPVPARAALTQRHQLAAAAVLAGVIALGQPALTISTAPAELTPAAITTAAPTAGSPAITQRHALTSAALSTAAPAPARATLAQRHQLTAPAISTAAPSAAGSSITQRHALAPSAVSTAAATAGSPAATLRAALAPAAVTTGQPAAGSSTLTQRHQLAGQGLTAGPTLDGVAITQRHQLAGVAITGSAPAISSPTLTGSHQLTAAAITSSPALQPVTVTQRHALAATAVTTMAVEIARPAISQRSQLAPSSVTAGSPSAASSSITQRHALAPAAISSAPIAADAPSITLAGQLGPVPTTTGTPLLGRPAISQGQQLAATAISSGQPAPARTTISQGHQLGAAAVTASPAAGRPSLSAAPGTYTLSAPTFTSSAPTAGRPAITVTAAATLAPKPVSTAAPQLGRAALAQHHQLEPLPVSTPAPTAGRPGEPAEILDPLQLGDQMLVSLDDAKQHLRLELDVLDDEADIKLKLDAAEQEVAEYIGRPVPWTDADGVEVPAPAPIKAAILMVLADLYENRAEGITGATHTINPTARRLLQRYRVFA